MITINDPGEALSAAQAQTLTAKAAAYPFDLHVLIGTGTLPRAVFEQQVDAAVTPGSRIVSIGVDPTHHYSHVHASARLGLPSGPTIALSGNAFFKQGDLVEGIDAIAAKANDLQVESRTVTSQSGVPIVIHEHKTAEGVWWALGGLGALVLGVVLWAVWRSKKRDSAAEAARVALNEEAAEIRSRNIEEQDWADRLASRSSRPAPARVPSTTSSYRPAPFVAYPTGIPVAPSAAPVIINNGVGGGGGNNGALDLMLGMELERSLERDRYVAPVVEREVVVERESSSSSNWGGGSDDSSSSSSFDSGSSDSSSSSDYGSSDSGGGDSSGGGDW